MEYMKIKEARQSAGLTQAEAAKILGVSKRSIESWEAGITNPKIPEEKIMEAYGIAEMLNSEAKEAFIAGELDYAEMAMQYKIRTAKSISKWGRYPDTFAACWNWIPESIFKVASPEALAELVDSIKECYDNAKAPTD